MAKRGPDNNSTAYIYRYIYIQLHVYIYIQSVYLHVYLHVCIYIIYIHMAVGSFAAANFAICGVLPQFYSKNWPKRDVANLPHLSIYVFDKIAQKWPGIAAPSIF